MNCNEQGLYLFIGVLKRGLMTLPPWPLDFELVDLYPVKSGGAPVLATIAEMRSEYMVKLGQTKLPPGLNPSLHA